MNTNSTRRALVVLAFTFGFFAAYAFGQEHVDRRLPLKKLLNGVNQLSPHVRNHLSPAMQMFLRHAEAVANAPSVSSSSSSRFAPLAIRRSSALLASPGPAGTIQVSNPAMDFQNQGYTQTTASSAWCGGSVVVGYEDTGAFFRTDPSETFGVPISLDGVSYSTNSGSTFTDIGFLTPGSFSANALLGSPVVTCTSGSDFQYASILNTTTPDGLDPIIGPSVSFSTNGGKTWSAPLQAIALDGNTELADKPWIAVDPTNPRRMYLSYTHISFLGCINIEVLTSSDSGKTWSQPAIVESDCDNQGVSMVTGSSVVVSPGGKVYVAYEFFPVPPAGASFTNNAIYFAMSIDGGKTFTAPYKVSEVVPGGDGVALNGNILANDYPHLAVDRTSLHSRGTIYITWPDGRDKIVPDSAAPSGNYAYPDIFVAKSTNFGRSFKILGAISPAPKAFSGIGRDQFLPGIAVDTTGSIAVCYYDRRNDRNNLRVDRYCSVSANQGKTWTDSRASGVNWMPAPDADPLDPNPSSAMGKYYTVSSDFLFRAFGFFAPFEVEIGGNPNIVAKKF